MSVREDLVPQRLLEKVKTDQNGRLEVTWRIYDALCKIPTGDLTEEQRRFIDIERKTAYDRWALEGALMNEDGLQGKLGFAAAKRQHLNDLKEKGQ